MITNLFFLLAGGLLNIIAGLFNAFPITIPDGVTTGFLYFIQAFRNMENLFPVTDAVIVVLFLLGVYWRVYLFKIILWGFGLLPFIGRHISTPTTTTTDSASFTSSDDGRTYSSRINKNHSTSTRSNRFNIR